MHKALEADGNNIILWLGAYCCTKAKLGACPRKKGTENFEVFSRTNFYNFSQNSENPQYYWGFGSYQ